jgi:hypothetical protein
MTDLFQQPPDPPPLPLSVRRFTAAYDSGCESCSGEIYEGEPAGYISGDDYASCGDCCDQAEEGTL